jgi:hypothetical protein
VSRWNTFPQIGANAVANDDLIAYSDTSLPELERSRTLSVGVLRRIVESKVIVTYTGSHTFDPATDLGAHEEFTAAGTFTIPAGLTVGTSWVVGNATTSDTVDIDGSAVTLLSNGVEVDNGGWVAFLVVGTNVVEAVGAFADAPSGGATQLNQLTDVSTTGASDGDVLTYDSGADEWIAAAPTGGTGDAEDIAYDPTASGLTATDVQAAIDEVATTSSNYTEGTWTPVLGGTGGQSGQAYSAQGGWYVKVGNLVTAWFDVTLSTEGTVTGNLQVQGLPFAAVNISSYRASAQIGIWQALGASYVYLTGLLSGNTTAINMLGITAAATSLSAPVGSAILTNTTRLSGSITYQAEP